MEKTWHLSYPYVFKDGEHIYMLPEQSTESLVLYKSINFPYEWNEEIILLNEQCVDSSIILYNNKYWIFTYNKRLKRHCIYFSDKLLTTEWNLHTHIPSNNELFSLHQGGRGAGNLFTIDNILYRPIQINHTRYGEGIQIYKIVKLTTIEFEEKIELEIHKTGIHHISFCNDILVFDYNTENPNPKFTQDMLNVFNFWNKNIDRIQQIKIYREIGYNLDQGKVLDIGYEYYNIYTKHLFNNDNIQYHQIDITITSKHQINPFYWNDSSKNKFNPDILSCDKFIQVDICHMIDIYPKYKEYYDVIISFGVLSFVIMEIENIKKYLYNVYILLKQGGLFYIKFDNIDPFNKDNNIKQEYFMNKFELLSNNKVDNYYFIKYKKI